MNRLDLIFVLLAQILTFGFAQNCVPVPEVENCGSDLSGPQPPGTVVTYACNSGFEMVNPAHNQITCVSHQAGPATSQLWEGDLPQCQLIVTCDALVVANGQADPSTEVSAGNEVTVTCDEGFELAGGSDGVATCGGDGSYDEEPTCTEIDDCAPEPCANGGTCTDGHLSFTCECADGFSGDTCTELAPTPNPEPTPGPEPTPAPNPTDCKKSKYFCKKFCKKPWGWAWGHGKKHGKGWGKHGKGWGKHSKSGSKSHEKKRAKRHGGWKKGGSGGKKGGRGGRGGGWGGKKGGSWFGRWKKYCAKCCKNNNKN